MLEHLKEEVCRANLALVKHGLVILTWGNVSAISEDRQYVVIKPSGVDYGTMTAEQMVVTDINGNLVEGSLRPSSDLPTHLEVYKAFPEVGGVVHTHSKWATAFAQAKVGIDAMGTTHGDYFYGTVPCTRDLTPEEIAADYEKNTGKVIAETFASLSTMDIPGVLVASHGVFTWGPDAGEAVEKAVILEEVAFMNYHALSLNPQAGAMGKALLDKHYLRKHGKNAYYGQK